MEKELDYFDYRSVVTGYRSFPLIALFALLIAFFAIWYTINNNVLAGLAAAVPVCLLILRWVHLARQLDCCVCARCGQRLPRKLCGSILLITARIATTLCGPDQPRDIRVHQ